MRLSPLVPLLVIAWPVAEIAAFIAVGSRIGILNTIGLVLLAAFAGLALIRIEGFELARRLRIELAAGRMPAADLASRFMVILAGLLLMVPGFVSDALALLLLFAPVRRALFVWLSARVLVRSSTFTGRSTRSGDGVVDLDPDDFHRGPDRPPPRRLDGGDGPRG